MRLREGDFMAGYIEERGNGTYRLVVSAGSNFEGKRIKHQETKKCPVKKCNKEYACSECNKAQKDLALFIADVTGGRSLEASKFTFAQFIELWWKDHALKKLRPKTRQRYNQLLPRIKYAIGHIRLDKLKAKNFADFYNDLAEDGVRLDGKEGGLELRTIMHHHRLITSILNKALQWEITKHNPAAHVTPDKTKTLKRKKIKYYNDEQLPLLFGALEKERMIKDSLGKEKKLKWVTASYLVFASGMRKEEIMGLEWEDVNFEDFSITINRTCQFIDKEIVIGDTKTDESQRTITLPESVIELLKKYKAQQSADKLLLGTKWQGSKRIFTGNNGADAFPDSFAQWFGRFIKRYKLPHISPHGLRHTNATYLISKKIDMKTVSARLGHSRMSTTSDIYTHIMKKPDQEAVDKISDLIDIK